MDLTKIVSISGKSGLFKMISQGKKAVIVEALADQKRFPVFGHEKMSSLEEISVFTTGEDLPLKDVLKTCYEKLEGKAALDPRSDNKTLLKFFKEMVPDFDEERVYVSDIRKMLTWYNTLLVQNLLDFTEPAGDKAAETEATAKGVEGLAEKAGAAEETPKAPEKAGAAEETPKAPEKPAAKPKPEKKALKKKKAE